VPRSQRLRRSAGPAPRMNRSRGCGEGQAMRSPDMGIIHRFWSKVDIRGATDCWPWTAARFPSGYGHFNSASIYAHRVAWELARGPIPRGMFILHSCDTPPCCNPAHLWIGTQKDNVADRDRKLRTAKGDRSGARLHPEKMRRGEQHPRAKLTSDIVVRIRLMAKAGHSYIAIAQCFGITAVHASRIARHESWRHIA
jgi:hypothetical protein